jgi:hypothetical protein
MTAPLKQIMTFTSEDDANAWLSARENERYETSIQFYGGEYCFIGIVYWDTTNKEEKE